MRQTCSKPWRPDPRCEYHGTLMSSQALKDSLSRGVFPGHLRNSGSLETPLGRVWIEAVPTGICRVEFVGEAATWGGAGGDVRSGTDKEGVGVEGLLAQAMHELIEYFEGRRKEFTVPLAPVGTPFQQRVWRGLLAIPFGVKWSYQHLAGQVGSPRSQRAVGSANGRNPIAVLIPCHRVVAKEDGVGGYSGGVWRKRWLLALEASRGLESGR